MTSHTTAVANNYAIWDSPILSQQDFTSKSVQEQLEYLSALGHLAPSSHNTQPWRFKVEATTAAIGVYLERTAVLAESDPTGRQAVISIGCAIANISSAARCYGLKARVVYSPELSAKRVTPQSSRGSRKQSCVALARITFTKVRSRSVRSTLKALFSRKVVRAEFDLAKPIPPAVLKAAQAIQPEKGIRLLCITKHPDRLRISELQAQADGYVANSPRFAKELGQWILPNDTSSYVGMPGSNFGMTLEGSKRLHAGLIGKGKLMPEDMLKFSLGSKFLMERSAALGFISARTDTPTDWLNAGRLAGELFLHFETHKVQVSVHAGLTEVGLVHDTFMSTYGQSGKLLVVFRAGYVKRADDLKRPHSPRLPLSQVLLS